MFSNCFKKAVVIILIMGFIPYGFTSKEKNIQSDKLAKKINLSETKALLTQAYRMRQMWALSLNYFYGATVKKDRLKAAAWRQLYLDMLPAHYPGKMKLLKPFIENLSKDELITAKNMAAVLKKRYFTGPPLDEKGLLKLFNAKKTSINKSLYSDVKPIANFDLFIKYIQQQDVQLAMAITLKKEELANKKGVMVYGRVIPKGITPGDEVKSNIAILSDGYFIDKVSSDTIHFSLLGYQSRTVTVNSKKAWQNIGAVFLEPLNAKEKSGMVGLLKPVKSVEYVFISLLRKGEDNQSKGTWPHPLIPLATLSNGQFYAVDLPPGDYQLVIATKDKVLKKNIHFQAGSIKDIGTIKLG